MLQIPRGAEREFLLVVGAAAIYCARLPNYACLVGVSRDLHLSHQGLQRRFPGSEIVFSFWVKDRSAADSVRRKALDLVRDDNSLARLCAIHRAAEQLGVVLTEHGVVMERVSAVVLKVDAKIEEANRSGELQWFNRAFREWRMAARPLGRVMSYSEAKARLRRVLIQRELQHTFPVMPSAIFPPLPTQRVD